MTTKIGVSRELLMDIATRSSLEPSLATVCAMRPDTTAVIAHQVLYVVHLMSMLNACRHATNHRVAMKEVLLKARRTRGATCALPSQLSIAVIGGGTVGRSIVQHILQSGMTHPSSLSVITRQPATLSHLAQCGVRCFPQEEVDVLRTADIVILSVQPSQIQAVGKRVAGCLKTTCFVVSVCCGVPVEKVCATLQHDICITTYVDVTSVAATASALLQEDDCIQSDARSMAILEEDADAMHPSFVQVKPLAADGRRRRQLLELAFPSDAWVPSLDQGSDGGDKDERDMADSAPPSFYFLDRLVWCLLQVEGRSSSGSSVVRALERLLTVWALMLPRAMRQRMLELFDTSDGMKQILNRSEATSTDADATRGRREPADVRNLPSDYHTVAWFARCVVVTDPLSVVDQMRLEFVEQLS